MIYTPKGKNLELAIALPFKINQYGVVDKTSDTKKIWADRVLSVIGTHIGERIFRPSFGTSTATSLFSTVTAATEAIQKEVKSAFVTWLPTLGLDSIDVVFDDYTNEVKVEVVYSLPDGKGIESVVGVIAISENLISTEERL